MAKLSGYKKDILKIYSAAIELVKPERLVGNALTIDNQTLRVRRPVVVGQSPSQQQLDNDIMVDLKTSRLHIIGGGKSVLPMATAIAKKAIASRTTGSFSSGKLILPSQLKVDETSAKLVEAIGVDFEHGAKDNLPDSNSVVASANMLQLIEQACERDLSAHLCPTFVLLIAGGGSACLTAPKYISLDEKLAITRHLVRRGADIVDLNRVRRFFSRVKGGQLAAYIFDRSKGRARIVSLILSDVIGDPIEYIASGPTYLPDRAEFGPEVNHYDSMVQVLKKFNYPQLSELESRCKQPAANCQVTQQPANTSQLINHIIGNNAIAIDAATREAKLLGYKVEHLGSDLSGQSGDIVANILKQARQTVEFCHEGEKVLLIGGGEATVVKKDDESWGLGGRVQEMALDYLLAARAAFANRQANNCPELFFAGSTDGQDGPTDVAACMASRCEWQLEHPDYALALIEEAKRTHNSNAFWNQVKPDWLVKTGLTQTNVMDLYMMVLAG